MDKHALKNEMAANVMTSVIVAALGTVLLGAASGRAGSASLCNLEAQEARAVADARQQGLPMSTIIAASESQTEQDQSDASFKSGAIMKRVIAEGYQRGLNPDETADIIRAQCEDGQ
jgi:hypothetical protein